MKFRIVEENELDKLANSAKKKNKKKHQQGWFVTLAGDPQKNIDAFNNATDTGGAPISACSEEFEDNVTYYWEVRYTTPYSEYEGFTYTTAETSKKAKSNVHYRMGNLPIRITATINLGKIIKKSFDTSKTPVEVYKHYPIYQQEDGTFYVSHLRMEFESVKDCIEYIDSITDED